MSSVVIAGDTSGSITLQAPSSAGSTVLTLPTTSATLITDSSDILNIGSGQIYKDASGNVGIGTSSPSTKLTVAGSITITGANALRGSYGAGGVTSNIAIGDNALLANTTGNNNSAMGQAALFRNTTGVQNSAIGVNALYSNTTGSYNTASGVSALQYNTTGVQNSAMGQAALYSNTTGNNNSAMGQAALYSNTTGSYNLALGQHSGLALTTGSNNTIIGSVAGTAGLSDTVIIAAGTTERMRIDASGNVGIGTSSPAVKLEVKGVSNAEAKISTDSNAYAYLTLNTWALDRAQLRAEAANPGAGSGTGSGVLSFWTANNSALAERMRIDSSGNVGIGTTSSYNATTDVLTVARNQNAITQLLIDNQNVGASSQTRLALEASGNGWYIANQKTGNPLTFSNNSGEKMRIDSSGNLLVGTTSAIPSGGGFVVKQGSAGVSFSVTDHTSGTATNQYYSVFTYAGTVIGHIDQSGTTGVSYVTTSDQRLKENIVDAPSALASVNAIKVRSFDWKVDGSHQDYGYIAQELLKVAPEAVSVPENEDEMMGVDFGKLTPRLVKSIQELKAIIDTQQEQINSLLGK